MLEMPRRSITRFFVPMIDVLTLLFSLYLLLPMVANPEGAESEADRQAREERLRWAEAELAKRGEQGEAMTAKLREEVERLRRLKTQELQNRLAVRVLEIDPNTGVLFYYDPDRQDIRTEADALRYITRQKALASKGGVLKDVFFLILYPRRVTPYPTETQLEQIKQWFKDGPYGIDRP